LSYIGLFYTNPNSLSFYIKILSNESKYTTKYLLYICILAQITIKLISIKRVNINKHGV